MRIVDLLKKQSITLGASPADKQEAIDMAVQSGAIRDTVEIIEVEDVPLAYYAGNTNRVKVKAAGDLCG